MAMCVGLSFSLSLFLSLLSVSILHLGRARVLSPLLPPVAVPALSLACSGFRAVCEVYVNFSLKPACVRCVCGRGRGRGRVHRFPNNKELFCAILGNGSQLVGVCVGVLVLACLGVYSQVRSLLVREHIL